MRLVAFDWICGQTVNVNEQLNIIAGSYFNARYLHAYRISATEVPPEFPLAALFLVGVVVVWISITGKVLASRTFARLAGCFWCAFGVVEWLPCFGIRRSSLTSQRLGLFAARQLNGALDFRVYRCLKCAHMKCDMV